METVTGIIGSSCAEVTSAIEAQLGTVVDTEQTSEFFAAQVYQTNVTTTQNALSQW